MRSGQDGQIDEYLGEVIRLVGRATPGLLVVKRTSDRRYSLTTPTGAPVGVINRRADAVVFARDRLDLRSLVVGAAEVLARHRDDGHGRCALDGEPMPCTTRCDLTMQLEQRADSA